MASVSCQAGSFIHGREAAVRYRDLISMCARSHSDTYDDQQELVSAVLLGLLKYPKPINRPEQFIRVMTRNMAINRARTGSGSWEVTESEIRNPAGEDGDGPAHLFHDSKVSEPIQQVVLRDTLSRLEHMLTPAEARCYFLLKAGFEQEDLPGKLGVSKQAVSKVLREIRQKFLAVNH